MNKSLMVVGLALAVNLGVYFTMSHKSQEAAVDSNSVTVPPSNVLKGEGAYSIDASESSLDWAGKKTLIADYIDNGVISLKDGQVTISNGSITGGQFTVDMSSISAEQTGKKMGADMLTKHLKSPDFFDVEKYPTSTFVITGVEKTISPDGNYIVNGNLTIKGITQPISFPANIYNDGVNVKADAKVVIDRTKWNVRYGSGSFFKNLGDNVIGDDFTLNLKLTSKPSSI